MDSTILLLILVVFCTSATLIVMTVWKLRQRTEMKKDVPYLRMDAETHLPPGVPPAGMEPRRGMVIAMPKPMIQKELPTPEAHYQVHPHVVPSCHDCSILVADLMQIPSKQWTVDDRTFLNADI